MTLYDSMVESYAPKSARDWHESEKGIDLEMLFLVECAQLIK